MKTLMIFWIQRYLKQGRILVLYALALVLFIVNAFIYTSRYEKALETNNRQSAFLREDLDSVENADALAGNFFTLIMPGTPLRFIADGNLDEVPTARGVTPHNSWLPVTASAQRQQLLGLWDIDLVFIVCVVFTFLAVVLTFDSVCGEREQGTLKLLMSSSAARSTIVLSKMFAACVAISIPLLLGMLANYTILNMNSVVTLNLDQVIIQIIFLVFSLLFIFIFISLGVFVSSLTRNPVTSLVLLLLIWVLLVVVIPGVIKPVSKELVRTSSPEEYSKSMNELLEDFFNEFKTTGARDRAVEIARADNFKGEIIWNRNRGDLIRKRQNLIDEQIRDLYNQAEIARAIARISPNMVYELALSRVVGTDFETVKDFMQQAARFKTILGNFMEEQDALDETSPHLLNSDGRGYLSTRPFTAEMPKFRYQPSSLAERLGDTALDVLVLFSMALFSLLASIFAFNRYDVR